MPIKAESVVKVYGKKPNAFTALRGVTLSIKDGESIAIIGKSGSGKSTLMHILATLDVPDEGTVAFGSGDLANAKQQKLDKLRNKEFGFIFQQFFLNGRETALENVMLPLKISGTKMRSRKNLALKALEEVDLVDKAKNKATDLSGGQKQRVCIARALVNDPSIIFADEPTGNLDSENGKRITELLFKLNKDKNITLIVVTHDEELASLCDRRFRMKDGLLTEEKK
ncbi:MAG: ABC transporter ATP-binding protein [Candidatus Woesebacteria bacterium]|jgi:putative ABC transport system ATP-binding protein